MDAEDGRKKRGVVVRNHLPADRPTILRLMDALVAVNSGLAKWNAVLSDGMQS
jgi:hypothetical protein